MASSVFPDPAVACIRKVRDGAAHLQHPVVSAGGKAHALKGGQTQLLIETPYRNAAMLQALVQTLQPNSRLSISWGLTLPGSRTRSGTVAQWRSWLRDGGEALHLPGKHDPAVFAFGR